MRFLPVPTPEWIRLFLVFSGFSLALPLMIDIWVHEVLLKSLLITAAADPDLRDAF